MDAKTEEKKLTIGVIGAGAIGTFVGAFLSRLNENIEKVVLIGRSGLQNALEANNGELQLSSVISSQNSFLAGTGGATFKVPVVDDIQEIQSDDHKLVCSSNASLIKSCDIVVVAVKSTQTQSVGKIISEIIEDAGEDSRISIVYSFQNGVGNADILRQEIGDSVECKSVIVGFNVVWHSNSFSRGTEGQFIMEKVERNVDASEKFTNSLISCGFPVSQFDSSEMVNLLYSKLLINMANAPNALSGIGVRQMLSINGWRRIFAASVKEALSIYSASGIKVMKVSMKLNPKRLPLLLSTPDFLFNCFQKIVMRVDENTKTSMLQDMISGKETEVDFLNGAIVRLAQENGVEAPINEKLVELVHLAEKRRAERGDSFAFPVDEVLQQLGMA